MSADSPAEYVRGLEENNRKLRVALVEALAKVQTLELELARENAAKLKAVDDLRALDAYCESILV